MRSIRWWFLVPAAVAVAWHGYAAVRSGLSLPRALLALATVAAAGWALRLRPEARPGALARMLAAAAVSLGLWGAVADWALRRKTLLALDVLALASAVVVTAVVLLALTRPAGGNPRPVRAALRLGLVASVLLLSLTAAEGALRSVFSINLYEPIPDDPRQGSCFVAAEPARMVPRPGFRGRFVHREFHGIPVTVNAWGLRDDAEAARPPAAGEASVLALGDSFVFGTGVPIEDTFHARLERRGEEICGRPLLVYNGGVPGYGAWQERRRLEELGPKTRPDVVVVAVLEDNDFQDSWSGARRARGEAPAAAGEEPVGRGARSLAGFLAGVARFRFWAATSALVQTTRLEKPLVAVGLIDPVVPTNRFLELCLRDERPPTVAKLRDALIGELDAIRQRSRALGARLVVMVVPSVIQAEPQRFETFLRTHPEGRRERFDRIGFHADFVARLAAEGFEVVDTLPALEEAARQGRSGYLEEGHWNARGHAIAAELLEPVLARLLAP